MISKEVFIFLEDLKSNNNKEWFHENKKRYEQFKKEYHQLVADILNELKPLDPSLELVEVKNCIFRINRDIRFSKDKSPYKTNMGIWITSNTDRKNGAGYYIHYEKGNSFIAGGIHNPTPDDLKKIRKEISFFYEELYEIINEKNFKKEFGQLDFDENNVLKKAPKDFDTNHPAIEILKYKSFTVSSKIDDKLFLENDFAKKIANKLIIIKPLNDFLNRAIESVE